MTEPVSFEIAKQLKKKGFDKGCYSYYVAEANENFLYRVLYVDDKSDMNKVSGKERYSAPTIAEVVMWLYKTHKIWIQVHFDFITADAFINGPEINNVELYSSLTGITPYKFTDPTQAYEAAIEYTLNNLI